LLHIEGMVLSFLTFVRNQVPNLFHFNCLGLDVESELGYIILLPFCSST
jgi:hypothetical protein